METLMDKNVGCGCIHTGIDKYARVGQLTVGLTVPESFNEKKYVEIHDFRSLRLTELFVHDHKEFQKIGIEEMGDKHVGNNKKIKAMVEYVNQNEGWTIIGWYRRGQTKDASNETVTTEAMETSLHIVLLVPSKVSIRDLKDENFNKLRLGAPAVAAPAS